MFFEKTRVKGRIIRCVFLISALAAFFGSVHAQDVKRDAEKVKSNLAVLASNYPSKNDFDAVVKREVKPLIGKMVSEIAKNTKKDSANAAAANLEELSNKVGLVEYIDSIKKVEGAIEDYEFKDEILKNMTNIVSQIGSKLDDWNKNPIYVRFDGSKGSAKFILTADEVGKVLSEKKGSSRRDQAFWLWKVIQQKYNIKV